jgi:hypothetical protein
MATENNTPTPRAHAPNPARVGFHRRLDDTYTQTADSFDDSPIVFLDANARADRIATLLRARVHELDRIVGLLTATVSETNKELADVLDIVWPATGQLVTLADAVVTRLKDERPS